MESNTKVARPSLKRLKARAKDAQRLQGLCLSKAFDLAAKQGGYEGMQDALHAARLPHDQQRLQERKPGAHKVYEHFPGGDLAPYLPCYGVLVGGIYWHIEVGRSGPELWRRDPGGLAPRRVSELGIFQVLLRTTSLASGQEALTWSTSTYGTYDIEELAGFQERDAQALSAHFGLPILRKYWRIDQQEMSEKLFLQSPAFAALRRAVRQGRVRPGYHDWMRGLTPVWNLLTMLSDENFERLGRDIVEALFTRRVQRSARVKKHWRPLTATLVKAWPAFDANVAAIQQEIAKVLPPRLAKQLI